MNINPVKWSNDKLILSIQHGLGKQINNWSWTDNIKKYPLDKLILNSLELGATRIKSRQSSVRRKLPSLQCSCQKNSITAYRRRNRMCVELCALLNWNIKSIDLSFSPWFVVFYSCERKINKIANGKKKHEQVVANICIHSGYIYYMHKKTQSIVFISICLFLSYFLFQVELAF